MLKPMLSRIISFFDFGNSKMLPRKTGPLRGRAYQFDYVDFNIKSGESVLDIGSGAHPFKYGTVQVDMYQEDNFHRGGTALKKDERPNIAADIENLPFADKQFDFAYCSHVLEHVANPAKACSEIIRVAKRGYIETPTRVSDIMFNYIYLHTWYVSMVGNTLIFMPYSVREKKGTGTNVFERDMHSEYKNEFSSLVYNNRELFNNMFLWENLFDYYVFDQEGRLIESSR